MIAIITLRRLGQRIEFEASMSYIVNSRPT
jgi:hypothetical protein